MQGEITGASAHPAALTEQLIRCQDHWAFGRAFPSRRGPWGLRHPLQHDRRRLPGMACCRNPLSYSCVAAFTDTTTPITSHSWPKWRSVIAGPAPRSVRARAHRRFARGSHRTRRCEPTKSRRAAAHSCVRRRRRSECPARRRRRTAVTSCRVESRQTGQRRELSRQSSICPPLWFESEAEQALREPCRWSWSCSPRDEEAPLVRQRIVMIQRTKQMVFPA